MRHAALTLLAVAALYTHTAQAELLVQSAPAASETVPANWSWQRPGDVTGAVKVLRGTANPWVLLAEVPETDRVFVCKDDATVAVGSRTTCTTRLPAGNNWMTKAEAFQAAAPAPTFGTVTFQWGTPTENTDGTPLTDLAGYRLFVRLQDCDPLLPNCQRSEYGQPIELGLVNTYVLAGVVREGCGLIQSRNVPGTVGPLTTSEVCGMKVLPPPKTIPGPVPDFRTQ